MRYIQTKTETSKNRINQKSYLTKFSGFTTIRNMMFVRLQLVAQAICLEEMMCTRIEEGDLYYGTTKRREHVEITDSLRQEVENICLQMHQYFDRQYTPNIKRTKSCNACSLKNICLPQLSKKKSVHNYILKTIKDGEL